MITVCHSNSTRGRYIKAQREIKKGCILIEQEPLLTLRFNDANDDDVDELNFCHRCFEKYEKQNEDMCEYCKLERYCSLECLRLARIEYHFKDGECAAFEAGREKSNMDNVLYPFDDVPNRLAIRTYSKLGRWTGREITTEEKEQISRNIRQSLKDVRAHDDVVPLLNDGNNSSFLSILCRNTRALMNDVNATLVKDEDFNFAAYAMRANAHTLYNNNNNTKKQIGVGLYPLESRSFNHSCDPSAEFFNGGGGDDDINDDCGSKKMMLTTLSVRLLRDVSKDEEITLSYLSTEERKNLSTEERREKLKAQYNFVCDCVRCNK